MAAPLQKRVLVVGLQVNRENHVIVAKRQFYDRAEPHRFSAPIACTKDEKRICLIKRELYTVRLILKTIPQALQ